MDKLKAAQRMLGFHTGGYVSKLENSEQMLLKPDYLVAPSRTFIKSGPDYSNEEICKHFNAPQERFPLLVGEIERKEAVIVELQRLLDEKDAEIDRLLEPTKWWRMLGWVIVTGTVLGVIAGVYEVIT